MSSNWKGPLNDLPPRYFQLCQIDQEWVGDNITNMSRSKLPVFLFNVRVVPPPPSANPTPPPAWPLRKNILSSRQPCMLRFPVMCEPLKQLTSNWSYSSNIRTKQNTFETPVHVSTCRCISLFQIWPICSISLFDASEIHSEVMVTVKDMFRAKSLMRLLQQCSSN